MDAEDHSAAVYTSFRAHLSSRQLQTGVLRDCLERHSRGPKKQKYLRFGRISFNVILGAIRLLDRQIWQDRQLSWPLKR